MDGKAVHILESPRRVLDDVVTFTKTSPWYSLEGLATFAPTTDLWKGAFALALHGDVYTIRLERLCRE